MNLHRLLMQRQAAGRPVTVGVIGAGNSWFSLFAPANTPRRIIDKLHASVQSLMRDKGLAGRLASEGMTLQGSQSPEEFAAFVASEHDRVGRLVQEAGLSVE